MTAGWLAAAGAGGGGSALGRVVLVAVAVLAVGTFAVLQVKARSRRRRRRPSDWRAVPPPRWPAEQDEPPSGQQDRYRPGWRYGYPPGYEPYPLYDPDRSPWAVGDDGRS